MTQVFKITPLYVGQEVSLWQCGTTGKVIKRLKNGLYMIEWKGDKLPMDRKSLGVYCLGQWKHGPYNESR